MLLSYRLLYLSYNFRHLFNFYHVIFYSSCFFEKKVLKLNKIGTVTVSIYKSDDKNTTSFDVKSDNEDVIQISYIVEDALKSY